MLRRGIRHRFSHIVSNLSDPRSGRDSLVTWHCLDQKCSDLSLLPKVPLFTCIQRSYESEVPISRVSCECSPIKTLLSYRSSTFVPRNLHVSWQHVRCMSSSSIELTADKDVVRFSIGKQTERAENPEARRKKLRTSKKAKLNELRLYRLKAKKKMNSPNPEVRIQYKLGKAKRKEEWLIEKLRKYEVPQAPAETYDPEILTEEEKFYLKRTGEKKKHYVPVGRRGVFGGVVLNMHLHWKNHETVKVVCKPCKPGQIHTYADELARLSKGIVIDIKPNNNILFYRGKNYVQPEIMLPQVTLSKAKAMEKYRFEQSLEHTSNFIEKLEKELEEYCNYNARFRQEKENATQSSTNNA